MTHEIGRAGDVLGDGIDSPLMATMYHELRVIGGNWVWFVVLGIALVLLGMVAISATVIASLATAVTIGALIFLSGIAETIGAFWCRRWSGFFLHLLSGVLAIIVGVLFVRAPVDALLALTLLVAMFLMVGGIFKIVTAVSLRFGSWGWPLVSGIIDVVLGLMIWQELPGSALWVIGLFVGINMVFRGINWIALGLALRSIVRPLAR